MQVSAGANIAERLMAVGDRHYGDLRRVAGNWLAKMEIDVGRLDDAPASSGGMQQRLQIARNLVTHPRLVFMDEPTASLDVSVQARLLDLLRQLVNDLGLAAIVVTHDLAVAAAGASHAGDARRRGGRKRPDRPDSRRSAASLHPVAGVFHPAELIHVQRHIHDRGAGPRKMFTLHNQGGIRLPVLDAVDFTASAGECLVLAGPSGAGKSTLLRCLYGNYLATEGSIRVRHGEEWVELVGAPNRASWRCAAR